MSALPGRRPTTPKPTPAAPGAIDGSRIVEMRRLAVQALGRLDWTLGTLVCVGEIVRAAPAPEGAEGARIGVVRAMHGSGDLRLQLIGALAVPGWSEATLKEIALRLVNSAPSFPGEEILALRLALRGLPS